MGRFTTDFRKIALNYLDLFRIKNIKYVLLFVFLCLRRDGFRPVDTQALILYLK